MNICASFEPNPEKSAQETVYFYVFFCSISGYLKKYCLQNFTDFKFEIIMLENCRKFKTHHSLPSTSKTLRACCILETFWALGHVKINREADLILVQSFYFIEHPSLAVGDVPIQFSFIRTEPFDL